jgi:hypothetical protein
MGFAMATAAMLFAAGEVLADGWDGRHVVKRRAPAYHHHYPSYYPAYAYGPGFVYEPNYAYLLGRLQYDYVTFPERRYNPGFCRFWAC